MIAVNILIVSGLLIIGPEFCQPTKPHDSPPPKTPSPGRHHISTDHSPRHPSPPSPANHRNEHPVASSHKHHPSHSRPLSSSPIGGGANHRPPPERYGQRQPAPLVSHRRDHHNPQKVHMDEQSPVKDTRTPLTPRPMADNMLSPKKSIPGSPLKSSAGTLSIDSNIRRAESFDPVPVKAPKPSFTKRKGVGLSLPAGLKMAPLQINKEEENEQLKKEEKNEKKWTLGECLIHCNDTVGYVFRKGEEPMFISKGTVDANQRCNCGPNIKLIDFLKEQGRNATGFEEAFKKNPWDARVWLTLEGFNVKFPETEYKKWDPKAEKQISMHEKNDPNPSRKPKKNEKVMQK